MEAHGTKIYVDTNVLRYFGTAFRASPLRDDLRDHLVMSPISILELLSQLATGGGTDALLAVQAVANVYHPDRTGLLPWPEDAFREAVFGISARSDTFTDAVAGTVNDCLTAATTQELHSESTRLRDFLNEAKDKTTGAFADFVNAYKTDGPLADDTQRRIFAHSIAKRAEVSTEEVHVDKVIDRLNALYIYEIARLQAASVMSLKFA